MEKKYYILVSLMLLAVFLGGSWYGARKGSPVGSADSRRILYYVDPMNPAHTSQEPGLAPCGMKMEPIYAESETGEIPPPFLAPGSVKITPQKQQIVGVRLGEIEKAPFIHTLRALGRVAVDETRIFRLSSYVDGWIQKTLNNTTGSLVMKDEVLATYYSRETLEEVRMYLSALNQMDKTRKGESQRFVNIGIDADLRVRQTEDALKNLGMGQMQIRELAQNRRLTQEIYLAAPVTSFILVRNVSPGQKISKGEELYKLADLSRVWIVVDLYENEAPLVKPGMRVLATLPHRHLAVWATVADILPEFDKASRTLKVRLEAENPDYVLRPDIFTDVEFTVNLPEAVIVPLDAVMNSGLKKTVFVDRGNGYFEPRKVETGWRFGDRVEITKGLEPGERIVISGNFLVDSESRMKLAAAGFAGDVARDPVSGVNVDENKAKAAGLQCRYNNQTYYFHAEESRRLFEQYPERYLEQQAKSQEAGKAVGRGTPGLSGAKCPVCGLEVDEAQARAKGLTSDYQGKTYYFCRYYCNREFDKAPGRYIKEEVAACCPQGDQKEKEDPLIVKDIVCGLEVNREEAAALRLKREYQGQAYFFCRDYCARQFDKSPERYVPCPVSSQTPPPGPPAAVTSAAPGLDKGAQQPTALTETPALAKDPVCGMNVETTVQNLHRTLYQGKTYYFCNDRCKEQFDREPERYLSQKTAAPALTAPPQALPIAPALPKPSQAQPAPSAPTAMPQPQETQVSPAPYPDEVDNAPPAIRDPVCGVCGQVAVRGPKDPLKYKTTYQGKTYDFCSQFCKEEFDKSPKDYATPGEAAPSPPTEVPKKVKKPSPKKEKVQKPKKAQSPPAVPPLAPSTAPSTGE